ncbi:hypothetical protein HMPREF0454_01083 [Hafnia alvei ATCC 51873]|uniref:Uncharacterized protein n=1 Tax=Hafnia alvei ATCC 51873 TaxID=1002364 RepID=G9Y3J6_HAFAL|nr:hypothetical protein HMPREF0454_01083 [Hafnia alvei ATCC 51873]
MPEIRRIVLISRLFAQKNVSYCDLNCIFLLLGYSYSSGARHLTPNEFISLA